MKKYIILLVSIALLSACGGKQEAGNVNQEVSNTNLVELTNDQMKNADIVIGKAEQKYFICIKSEWCG